jgi:hypothetical protein
MHALEGMCARKNPSRIAQNDARSFARTPHISMARDAVSGFLHSSQSLRFLGVGRNDRSPSRSLMPTPGGPQLSLHCHRQPNRIRSIAEEVSFFDAHLKASQ